MLLARSGEEPFKSLHRRNLVKLSASDQFRQTYLHRINFVGFACRSALPRLSVVLLLRLRFVHFDSYFVRFAHCDVAATTTTTTTISAAASTTTKTDYS